jgi:hypothetical protein
LIGFRPTFLGCCVLPLQGADGWDLITQGVALGQIVLHFQCEKQVP